MKKAILTGITLVLFLLTGTRFGNPCAQAGEPADKAAGRWLLHEYHDRIMNNRCIGEFSFNQAVWSAILVYVTADSVFTDGSVMGRQAYARMDGDTLAYVSGTGGTKIPLYYSSTKKELQIMFPEEEKTETFYYRRLRSTELQALVKGTNVSSGRWQLQTNYNAFFRKEFFSGTFTGLNGKAFTISDEGAVQNFGKWNAVWIDDFFGTSHWTGKQDRVRFEDSTNTRNFQDYNWRYKGDTLILRKYIGNDIELYTLSKTEERYVRTPLR
jgi:hypothetical protein